MRNALLAACLLFCAASARDSFAQGAVSLNWDSASWQTLDGTDTPWAISQEQVTANDPANTTHCPNTETTPVRAKTWGMLKSQYRN